MSSENRRAEEKRQKEQANRFRPPIVPVRLAMIALASVLMAVNINTFVNAGGLFPGGATGLSVLIQRCALKYAGISLPYSPINIALNAIPIYIGFRYIGKKFTAFSLLCIFLSSTFTDLIPGYQITTDPLLAAVFGGILNGLAISICLSADATTGGTDFLSIFLSERKNIDSWNIILGINVIILGTAGALFGWDKALYSIIFQYVSTQIIHALYRRYQQQTLFIVTEHPEEICDLIMQQSHHSATILSDAEGAYDRQPRCVVYSVVSRGEYKRIVAKIREADPHAFVNAVRTDYLSGRFFRRPTD